MEEAVKTKVVHYPNLVAEMARSGQTNNSLAKLLGISPASMSRRVKGDTDFTKSEIDTLCDFFAKDYEYLFGR